ncbi:MAG: BatD family protein, partial [Sulfurovum sp.]|nr:BatD family protein [Sulfurovum sp.]
MKKLLLILFITLLTWLNAAGVKAVVSQTDVVQGNPVQLKIVAEGDKAEFPQIQEIDGVPVEGRSQTQHTSLQIINGKSTVAHTTNLILTFTPKKDMTIPSYTVKVDGKDYQTQPIQITVSRSTAPQGVSNGQFSLTMKADKKEVIVGEPLLVTVYFSLRNDVRLADNPQYDRPEFKGFFVKEVADQKSYMKGDHRITELRYILIPQKPGHYTIAPATAKIGLADTSRRDIFGRFFGTIWKPIASNSLEIDVKPAPQDADLIGRFYIESQIDKTVTKENKPVNLTVTIEGDGSLDDYEMPGYDIDGVTVYSDDAEVTTKVIGNKLKSTYVKKFAFIADHDFEIPARSLSAYDPQTKETKTLEIPGYSIKVEASRHAAAETVPEGTGREPHSGVVQTDLKLD